LKVIGNWLEPKLGAIYNKSLINEPIIFVSNYRVDIWISNDIKLFLIGSKIDGIMPEKSKDFPNPY
jgi:hypothetical protein